MKKVIAVLIISLSFCATANAGWHNAKINKITTYLNGGIYVEVDSVHECASNLIGMDSAAAGFKNVYSALLAYEAQHKTVAFSIVSCSGSTGIIDRIVSQP